MRSTAAFVFLCAIASAVAQSLTVNTPTGALNCLAQLITWVGGTGPYTLQIQPGGDVTAAALETFVGLTGNSYSWLVIEPANTQVFIRLRDSVGTTVESGTFTIRAGGTCPVTTPGATTSGGSTTPAAPPPTTTPAGTTPPATTAPGGATTTPASSGTTTSRASTTTPNAAAGAAKVAGGLVGVAVAGVVAMLV